MSMRGAVAVCVVLMCLMALQVERTEGHVTFFSPKEMQVLKDRVGKKDMEPRSEDGQFEDVTVRQLPETDGAGASDKSVEIAVRLTPQHVAPVLEEILHEVVEEHQRAK